VWELGTLINVQCSFPDAVGSSSVALKKITTLESIRYSSQGHITMKLTDADSVRLWRISTTIALQNYKLYQS